MKRTESTSSPQALNKTQPEEFDLAGGPLKPDFGLSGAVQSWTEKLGGKTERSQ